MAAELGAYHALFQLPHRDSHGHLYHQQRGITEPVTAQDHQGSRRLPQRRSRTEVAVPGAAASCQEMDDADSSLARGAEPLYDSLAGADAGPGKGGIMNHRLLHRWAREEALPLPSRTHPQTQKQTSAIYTEELTDLDQPWAHTRISRARRSLLSYKECLFRVSLKLLLPLRTLSLKRFPFGHLHLLSLLTMRV